MTRHHYLLPLLLAVALLACRSASTPAVHSASLDQEIQLAPGEQAVYSQQRLTVEFVRVVTDSRCPTDATCFWAGEVTVQLAIWTDGAAAVQHEIKAGEHATFGEYRLAVVRVEPERVSTRQIAPEEYRVTVKLERANASGSI